MPSWDVSQYLQFSNERTRPCHDLIARILLAEPQRIIDLGCGPGNSTAPLRERWSQAEITGLDSSTEMIVAAKKAFPEGRWMVGDIATWTSFPPYDLVFSNAALQWLPDHATLFPYLFRQVAADGALAIQVPANVQAPAHQAMQSLTQSAAWRNYFPQAVREWFVHEPAFYYDVLAPCAHHLDLWMTEYQQIMEGPEAIVSWYKGTGLRPFLDLLSEDGKNRFLHDYLALITEVYPRRADGRVLFPFLRLFMVAYK